MIRRIWKVWKSFKIRSNFFVNIFKSLKLETGINKSSLFSIFTISLFIIPILNWIMTDWHKALHSRTTYVMHYLAILSFCLTFIYYIVRICKSYKIYIKLSHHPQGIYKQINIKLFIPYKDRVSWRKCDTIIYSYM